MTPSNHHPRPEVSELRARVVRAQESAARTPIVSLLGQSPEGVPPGYSAWAVGPLFGVRSLVLMPTLSDDAPPVMEERLIARIVATGTGACPLCGRAAGGPLVSDEAGPLVIDIRHDEGCPAVITQTDRKWFPVYLDEDAERTS